MRLLLITAILCPLLSMCQPLQVKGRVIDEQGNPVASASILLKRTGNTTLSDQEGSFVLTNLHVNDTIIISAVGFRSEQVPLDAYRRDNITIILSQRISILDEALVIAYGSATRRFTIGSVSKVSAEEILKQPVLNPIAALEGRVPGLLIEQNNGIPGSSFKIQVRGQNSLLQGSDPLFIVDGIPFAAGNASLNVVANATGTGGISPFNLINPAEIESIEVLKDAEATSIYGSRGANGVVMITTKKGKAGKTNFTFNYRTGRSRVTRTMGMLHTTEYLAMRREAFSNDGVLPTIANAPDLLLWDTSRYTNFKELFLGGTAISNDLSLSVTGGSGGTKFLLTGAYNDEGGIFPEGIGARRASLYMNLNHKTANKKLELNWSNMFSSNLHNLLNADLSGYINIAPHLPLYDSLGGLNWKAGNAALASLGLTNPLAVLNRKYSGRFESILTSFVLQYRISKTFTLRSSQSFSSIKSNEHTIFPSSSLDPYTGQLPSAEFGNLDSRTWIIEPQAEYNNYFNKLKINVLAGASFQKQSDESMLMSAYDYTSDILLNTPAAAGRLQARNNETEYNYQAVFGRIGFNYGGSYLLNFSGRRDGSSRFGPANSFANFGAISAGIIFTEWSWVKNISWLSFGKLRGSYGSSGNDQIGDYKYFNTWSTTNNTYGGLPGLQPSRLYNPDYQWETNKKLELGIELGLLKDKIYITASAYRNRSGNQLVNYALPIQTGFPNVQKNLDALIENKGIELVVTGSSFVTGKFSWSPSLNFTFPKNKLVSFPNLEATTYANVFTIGYPLSSKKVYQYLGVDKETGIYQFTDADKNGNMDLSDRVVIINTDPKFYGGFQNSFGYGGLAFDVLIEFRKQTGRNYLATQSTFIPGYYFYNQPRIVLERWQQPGDQSSIQRFTATTASPAFKPGQSCLPVSDAIYSDASFARIKNVSISYQLPERMIKSLHAESCRLSLQAQNLLTITNYIGADPENQNLYRMPPLRTMAAAIQINF